MKVKKFYTKEEWQLYSAIAWHNKKLYHSCTHLYAEIDVISKMDELEAAIDYEECRLYLDKPGLKSQKKLSCVHFRIDKHQMLHPELVASLKETTHEEAANLIAEMLREEIALEEMEDAEAEAIDDGDTPDDFRPEYKPTLAKFLEEEKARKDAELSDEDDVSDLEDVVDVLDEVSVVDEEEEDGENDEFIEELLGQFGTDNNDDADGTEDADDVEEEEEEENMEERIAAEIAAREAEENENCMVIEQKQTEVEVETGTAEVAEVEVGQKETGERKIDEESVPSLDEFLESFEKQWGL